MTKQAGTTEITVADPFLKRSALRELAEWYFRARLSREEYAEHRRHLIDHLCGLESAPDPLVMMLIRQSENVIPLVSRSPDPGDALRPDVTVTPTRTPTAVRKAVQIPCMDKQPDMENVTDSRSGIPQDTNGDLPRSQLAARLLAIAVAVLLVLALSSLIVK